MVSPFAGLAKYAMQQKMPDLPETSTATLLAQKQQMGGDPYAGMYVVGNQMRDQGNYDRYLALRQIFDENKKAEVDALVAEAVKQEAIKAAQEEAMARMKYGTMQNVANTQADAKRYAADKSFEGSKYKADTSLENTEKGNQTKKDLQKESIMFKATEGEKNRANRLEVAKEKGKGGLEPGLLAALLREKQ